VNRPRLLDLYCGAGGAAVGYHRAGFDIIGVDIEQQPNYPYEFHQADALTFPFDGYDAIHASPPCQRYSRGVLDRNRDAHPDLLPPTRARLTAAAVPWVIENVPGAPMRADYQLCGCMFGLPQLRRERWFETSWGGFDMRSPCWHTGSAVTVSGHGLPSKSRARLRGERQTVDDWRHAMGIDWMNRDEMAQAIPPAYTEYIGEQLLAHIRGGVAA
jgi:site-specific DNA-cytosine methylase